MSESENSKTPLLAIGMLVVGIVGELAYGLVTHNLSVGRDNPSLVVGATWMRYVPWACWVVLLFRPGFRRLVVGIAAILAAVMFVFLSETVVFSWLPAPPRDHVSTGLDDSLSIGDEVSVEPILDIDGNPFELSAYDGRPVLMNVWRTWCGPCMSEMADLDAIDGSETSVGSIAVIGINSEPSDLQRRTRKRLGVRFRLLVVPDTIPQFDVPQFPTSFLVVRGKVVAKWTGTHPNLRQHVRSALRDADREVAH